ncbi:hypothetical protein BFJ63_vAg17603 [Fusarium oxysporum f. sp. narcissi]|uniref:BHLH domain-containing protein n=1 Tax=Fusarium oxysporum f. sp. narcissi TaxID=451672 RepID=A0A4Q2UYH4_FUSOX|nr:hypothetical protein BFJ63_vAg17603 [Fusarium oxysporum f. sp. narcissi]
MAACSIATEPSGLYWDRKGSRPEPSIDHTLDPFSKGEKPAQPCNGSRRSYVLDTIFVDPRRIATCDLSTPSIVAPTFASFQSSPIATPDDPCASDPAFSYFVPRKGNDEYVFQSRHTIGSTSSALSPGAIWPNLDHGAILGRLFEAGSPESNGCNEIYGANHESSDVPKAPVEVKMRSASRKPKRLRRKSTVPLNIQHARECHNNVEKQYRTRLKIRFEKLLMVLQASKLKNEGKGEDDSVDPDYSYSRGEVLDAARQRILALEEVNKCLTSQIKELKKSFMAGRGRQ